VFAQHARMQQVVDTVVEFVGGHWTNAVEIALLAVLIYYGYLYFRGTPGAKILVGLAVVVISLTLASQLLDLHVIGWLIRSFSVFLAIALVVIFQPELRRALTELGSHHFFRSGLQKKETLDLLVDTVFDLARRQFGALIALERDISIRQFASTGVDLDAVFSKELILTIFHPKTVLHDGGVIVQGDRVTAAACIFPLTTREDLDRSLGLRHRAGMGITEESDAIAVLVSEETGHVSLCHRGILERNLNIDRFRRRLNQLLLLEKYETDSPSQLEN
jgi:diadenylate cyclase